jgi:hypothetical protein
MQRIPSAIEVLERALERTIAARRVCSAIVHVARMTLFALVEFDARTLKNALDLANGVLLQERAAHELTFAFDAAERYLRTAERRGAAAQDIAAGRCVRTVLQIVDNISRAKSGNKALAVECLQQAVFATDRSLTWPNRPEDRVACTFAAFLPAEIEDWPEYESVVSRVLRPARDHYKVVFAALDGVNDGAEAWEVLAARELIPVEWADDSKRSFRGGVRDRWGRVRMTASASPPDVRSAMTLASDPAGILAAERLSREVGSALHDWGVQEPQHFEWNVLDSSGLAALGKLAVPAELESSMRYIRLTTAERAWAEGRASAIENVYSGSTYLPHGLREALSLAEFWRVMVEIDARFPSQRVPEAWQEQPVAAVKCPFSALLSVWAVGYALVSLEGHCARLAAPMIQP